MNNDIIALEEISAVEELKLSDEESIFDSFWRFLEKYSLAAGMIFKVKIRIHILTIFGMAIWFFRVRSFSDLIERGILFFSIFVVLFIHEMGHALSARYFGNTVKGLVLAPPYLGLTLVVFKSCALERIIITFAGPFINIILGVSMFLLVEYGGITYTSIYTAHIVTAFWLLNLAIGLLNLIPVYPLDGGKILKDLFICCNTDNRSANVATILFSLSSFIVTTMYLWINSEIAGIILLSVIFILGLYALVGNDDFENTYESNT